MLLPSLFSTFSEVFVSFSLFHFESFLNTAWLSSFSFIFSFGTSLESTLRWVRSVETDNCCFVFSDPLWIQPLRENARSFLFILINLCIWVLPTWVYMHHVCGSSSKGQKRVSDLPEVIVNHLIQVLGVALQSSARAGGQALLTTEPLLRPDSC